MNLVLPGPGAYSVVAAPASLTEILEACSFPGSFWVGFCPFTGASRVRPWPPTVGLLFFTEFSGKMFCISCVTPDGYWLCFCLYSLQTKCLLRLCVVGVPQPWDCAPCNLLELLFYFVLSVGGQMVDSSIWYLHCPPVSDLECSLDNFRSVALATAAPVSALTWLNMQRSMKTLLDMVEHAEVMRTLHFSGCVTSVGYLCLSFLNCQRTVTVSTPSLIW